MFFRQLQYLVALSEEEHFGRAADRCNVSQPSLSIAVKQLEFQLSVPIVLRGRRFLGFTAEGVRVVEWAKRVISQRDAMLVELSGMRNNFEGKMRIGAMPNSSPVLPLFNQILAEKHPGISIGLQFLGIDKMKLNLNNYALDVGITYLDQKEVKDLNSIPVYLERLSLLVPDSEKYKDRTVITWEEASKLPLCLLDQAMPERKIVDDAFSQLNFTPKPVVTASDSILNLIFHVMFAGLATVIPRHFVRMPGQFSGVRALDLIEPEITQEVGLVWLPNEPVMPMANVMVSIIQNLKSSGDLEKRLGELSEYKASS